MNRPNIVLILNDDMGYSDLSCYGGEIPTPNLDKLARGGLRFSQFYNTARCCPSRASLLTGLHPHQADVGHMMGDDGIDGYLGDLSMNAVTIAEALKSSGYLTGMSGKWHVTNRMKETANWPRQRGFDQFTGLLGGASSFYHPCTWAVENEYVQESDLSKDFFVTDAISNTAIDQIQAWSKQDQPFFQYVAYTAPHWPLHAHEEDIAAMKGRFDAGWDILREERIKRMVKLGLIDPEWVLSPRDESQPPWEEAEHKAWELRRMEVYAAQIHRMDRGIGRIVEALEATGKLDNTLILFLADNGGCAEVLTDGFGNFSAGKSWWPETRDGRPVKYGNRTDVLPGADDTYMSYGVAWANTSNTPFRYYKHWVHEGGISTPLIAHWPVGMGDNNGLLCHTPAQLPDIMATCLDVAQAKYPDQYEGREIQALEGYPLTDLLKGGTQFGRDTLTWEHEGNSAIRRGPWKLVRRYPGDWELYNMEKDRTELNDLSKVHPEMVTVLLEAYQAWAKRCKVMPWKELTELRKSKK